MSDENENQGRGSPEPESDPSPEEQFERALEDLSDEDLRDRKFETGDDASPDGEEAADEEARGNLADHLDGLRDRDWPEREPEEADREEREEDEGEDRSGGVDPEEVQKFEAAMRDVEPIDGDSKYRRPSDPDADGLLDETPARSAEDFVTPTLPKSGEGLNDIPKLGEEQEAMLERCRRWEQSHDVPVLNLRGETASEATERLFHFFEQAEAVGARFVRIIHGRGLQSDGPPVLKPAVLEWLETRAADRIRGYVPERQFGGDYGAMIVEFRSGG